MTNVFIFVLVAVLLSLTYVLWQQIKQQPRFQPKSKLDKSLDQQLLTMLGGDQPAALRLLRSARKNNPGRSYLWYHEKVIRDLSRDRRC
ncbi:MAG: hypothetical protein HC939_20100 [Pleurocapsa sp. SU_5_0]|nr:hypothetical protein [Pleurocapsa sp. SU_5_0]